MSRLVTMMAESADRKGLDGQWMEILRAGMHDGENYTPADLDGMIKDHALRGDFNKAPVALGLPSQNDSKPIGRIDALRRVENSLQGRFAGIDPRVEHLYRRGIFPKTSVQVKRSLDGDSLQRVGLIHPTYSGGAWHDNGTPSLDELEKQHMGNKDHVFKGKQGYREFELSATFAEPGARADAVIAHLKGRGFWSDRCDRACLPLLFSELEGTPALSSLAQSLVGIMKKADPTSTLLSERARYWARTHSVSFGDALATISQASWDDHRDQVPVTEQQREMEREIAKKAIAAGVLNKELARLAWERVASTGSTFKQALAEVGSEHPELAVGQIVDYFSKGSQPTG